KSFTLPQNLYDVDYREQESQPSPVYEGHNPYAWGPTTTPPQKPKASKDRYVAGLILLVVGLFFLLQQLDLFYWRDFTRFWPVLIIIIGLATIFGAFNGKNHPILPPQNESDKTPPQETDQPTDNNGEEHSYNK